MTYYSLKATVLGLFFIIISFPAYSEITEITTSDKTLPIKSTLSIEEKQGIVESEESFEIDFDKDKDKSSTFSFKDHDWLKKAGVGFVLSGYFAGISGWYDFKIGTEESHFIHTQVIYDYATANSAGTILAINRLALLSTFKDSLWALKGIYYGIGGGFSQNQLNYQNTYTDSEHKAVGSGLFLQGEIGVEINIKLQNVETFSMNFCFQLGSYLLYSDNYDESKISNLTNHRSIVNSGWSAAKQLDRLLMGASVTF